MAQNTSQPSDHSGSNATARVWARLDNQQLETWYRDYAWFAEFGEPQYRPDCARTRDEIVEECLRRGRQEMMQHARGPLVMSAGGTE